RRERWWQYAERAPKLYQAVKGLDRILVVALVSRTVMPVRVTSHQVLSHKLGVFATSTDADLALLSSSFHSLWAWRNSSTMKADLNYSPSDAYETFPWPGSIVELTAMGKMLEIVRSSVMENRQLGLTKIYSLLHNSTVADDDILGLRNLHGEIDRAVSDAYGWGDLNLGHGFHPARQGLRYTVDPVTRIEILDRLLERNHDQRHRESNNITSDRKTKEREKNRNKTSARLPGTPASIDDVLF
ncbi:type IIL restriction-modification enzyme MmeI, partial [Streptomyces sp. NPDC059906]|uniref:type IIL restriction-modification enzyme MmeI n=1 Tax=Streptomyces sp. NPDC059906 TaxID=3346997 RepID=UPI0036665BFA